MVVRAKQVYKFAEEVWYPELRSLGFAEKNGEYHRILDSGVVDLMAISKDPHGGETFQVMCGVDAMPLKEEVGGFGYMKYDGLRHLTPKGWDNNSGRWPCVTEEETRSSVAALISLILDLALPYFAPITTLTDVAEEINEVREPDLLWMKARLLMLDRNISGARAAIEAYAEWAAKPRNWGTKESQRQDIERAEKVRTEIEAAAHRVME